MLNYKPHGSFISKEFFVNVLLKYHVEVTVHPSLLPAAFKYFQGPESHQPFKIISAIVSMLHSPASQSSYITYYILFDNINYVNFQLNYKWDD